MTEKKPYTVTEAMVTAYDQAHAATWRECAPTTQGEAVSVSRKAIRAGLQAALALAPEHRHGPGGCCTVADDDPRHIIELRGTGWTIKHPLACRPDLFACRVNLAAEELDGPPVPPGRYVATVDGIDGRLRIGDRVDQKVRSDG